MRADESTAKLRLLLVEPFAWGHGVGSALVDVYMAFARDCGYEALTLWTNDVLVEARALYKRLGFTLEHSDPHHSFGRDPIGQYWRPG